MTLLSIAQRVADEVGLPRPTSIAASSDQLARQLHALANTTLEELAEMPWPVLNLRGAFILVAHQMQYDLPADFGRMLSDTLYNYNSKVPVRGAVDVAEWQDTRYGQMYTPAQYSFRLSEEPLVLNVWPSPTADGEILSYQYQSSHLAKDASNVRIPLYASDTDTSVVPETVVRMGLKWRIKHAKGLDFSEDFNRYEKARATALAQQTASGSIPVAVKPADAALTNGYIPENGYGV